MKFLLDVHVSTLIGRQLTERGYDIVRASDRLADWPDRDLLAWAVAEDRILVTEDSDFSDLIYRDRLPPPPSVIYLRCRAIDQAQIADRLMLVLENTGFSGHMVVIERTSVRHRPLPEKSNDHG